MASSSRATRASLTTLSVANNDLDGGDAAPEVAGSVGVTIAASTAGGSVTVSANDITGFVKGVTVGAGNTATITGNAARSTATSSASTSTAARPRSAATTSTTTRPASASPTAERATLTTTISKATQTQITAPTCGLTPGGRDHRRRADRQHVCRRHLHRQRRNIAGPVIALSHVQHL